MNKKLTFNCPCGFYCETIRQDDAVALIQLHVQRSHKDHMPFGITKTEALVLLREEQFEEQKKKVSDRTMVLVH